MHTINNNIPSIIGCTTIFAKDAAFTMTERPNIKDELPDGYIHTFILRNPQKSMMSWYKIIASGKVKCLYQFFFLNDPSFLACETLLFNIPYKLSKTVPPGHIPHPYPHLWLHASNISLS